MASLLRHKPAIRLIARFTNIAASRMQSQMPKAVIFDKDGTLICFHSMWRPWVRGTAQRLSRKSGLNLDDKVYNLLGYCPTTERVRPGMLAEAPMPTIKSALYNLLLQEGFSLADASSVMQDIWAESDSSGAEAVKPIGDVIALLQDLRRRGLKLAVSTSDSRQGTEKALSTLGVTHLFDYVLCGDDHGIETKPSPGNAWHVCRQLSVLPHETVMVGDTRTDLRMAKDAGLAYSVGVLSGIGAPEDLHDVADYLVADVHDLVSIFERSAPSRPAAEQPANDSETKCIPRTSSILSRPPPPLGQPPGRHYSTASRAGSFDYVIVGAGSAGCVLANRLTGEGHRVLLLEAGPKDTGNWDSWKMQMPAALMYNLCDDKYNWYYQTVPQRHMDNRVMYWPRGRVWGGSSSLNAMVYVRGHALDYDRWEKQGATGWSYAACLPYFRRAETYSRGPDEYRGGDGLLRVSRGPHIHSNPLYRAFLEAGQQAGYPFTEDMNGFQQEGFGYMDMTIHEGRRWSVATSHLRPALSRKNLTAEARCLVNRILFNGRRAIGVEYEQGGHQLQALADREVVLCGGAINSPQLLMLSGIGDGDHLRKTGIEVVQHLPGVGSNLQDHLEVYVQHECMQPITLYRAQWKYPVNMVKIGLQWFLFKKGLASSAHLEAGAFIRSRPGVEHPDIQYHFLTSAVYDHGRVSGDSEAYQVHVGPMRATSTGTVRLQSKNPRDHPLIDPNYLATEMDRWEMRQCIKLSREIHAQKAFEPFRGKEIQPGPAVQSDDQIDAFLRAKSDSAYHPSCTCKMGAEKDSMAVVDAECRVRGVEALRVVDASIMPSVVSGNLNAPVIMMAEKASDIIMGKKPLPLSSAPVWRPKTLDTQR